MLETHYFHENTSTEKTHFSIGPLL